MEYIRGHLWYSGNDRKVSGEFAIFRVAKSDSKELSIVSWYFYLVTCLPLVEQELLTLSEHLSSLPVLVGFVLLDLQFYVYVL